MLQVAWLVDGDPSVLLRLRGLSPDDLQSEVAATPADQPDPSADDLAVALDAALRAARIVALVDEPGAEILHLL
jgi:uncharacterized Zn finger protein